MDMKTKVIILFKAGTFDNVESEWVWFAITINPMNIKMKHPIIMICMIICEYVVNEALV